jgi:hypothetical protein
VALILVSTKSGSNGLDLPPWKGLKMFLHTSLNPWIGEQGAMKLIASTLYPPAFLQERAPDGRLREEVVVEELLDRVRMGVKQPFAGRIGQMHAALWVSIAGRRA